MKKVKVTDHALIRYLERAGGFDMEKLRREIEKRVYRTAPDGCNGLTIDGVTFVIVESPVERTVTTVFDGNWTYKGAGK